MKNKDHNAITAMPTQTASKQQVEAFEEQSGHETMCQTTTDYPIRVHEPDVECVVMLGYD